MREVRKFLGAGLLVLAALILAFKFKAALGWSPDLILPALAVAGFFLNVYALALVVFLTVWVLNWQTGLPLELWILALTSFGALLGRKFLPSSPWLTLAGVIGVGEILIYASADPGIFFANLGFIISNIIFAVLFGLALLTLLEWVYEER